MHRVLSEYCPFRSIRNRCVTDYNKVDPFTLVEILVDADKVRVSFLVLQVKNGRIAKVQV